eukprot:CAMPEP_0174981456 /NCGR_PEP_ID=MMETSP0004_2-20121128/15902_1 /TAXON_ID=420556 /ORGANISM="Ochromonas sp., Strain CCMP1393" /LENGTH=277 /DNA_ID=CAMNT_0016233207 /DNA_START=493 /DNA_END=1323 /DNA_ORIENTATION=+
MVKTARPVVDINSGFQLQLRAYEAANYDVYVAQQILLRKRVRELHQYRGNSTYVTLSEQRLSKRGGGRRGGGGGGGSDSRRSSVDSVDTMGSSATINSGLISMINYIQQQHQGQNNTNSNMNNTVEGSNQRIDPPVADDGAPVLDEGVNPNPHPSHHPQQQQQQLVVEAAVGPAATGHKRTYNEAKSTNGRPSSNDSTNRAGGNGEGEEEEGGGRGGGASVDTTGGSGMDVVDSDDESSRIMQAVSLAGGFIKAASISDLDPQDAADFRSGLLGTNS